MKTLVFYTILLFVCLEANIVFAQDYPRSTNTLNEPKTTAYTTANVNLRTYPSTSAQIVCVIPANTKVEILSSSGDWYSVEYQCYEGQYLVAKYGYVNKSYLHWLFIICFVTLWKEVKMVQVAINNKSKEAKALLEYLKKLSFVKILDEEQSPYDEDFVKKIHKIVEKDTFREIDPSKLWRYTTSLFPKLRKNNLKSIRKPEI